MTVSLRDGDSVVTVITTTSELDEKVTHYTEIILLTPEQAVSAGDKVESTREWALPSWSLRCRILWWTTESLVLLKLPRTNTESLQEHRSCLGNITFRSASMVMAIFTFGLLWWTTEFLVFLENCRVRVPKRLHEHRSLLGSPTFGGDCMATGIFTSNSFLRSVR